MALFYIVFTFKKYNFQNTFLYILGLDIYYQVRKSGILISFAIPQMGW